MPKVGSVRHIHIPLGRLPARAEERSEMLNRYFCELVATAEESKAGWKISLRRPPTLDFYVDPELISGLRWWRREIQPVSVLQIAYAVARRRGYVLSMSDAWTIRSWSEWFQASPCSKQTITILHVDDHRDFMSPRIAKSRLGPVDMLTGAPVDLAKTNTVESAIRSGCIGIGSFFVPFLHEVDAVDIRQLTARDRIKTSGSRALTLELTPDTLLDPEANRFTMRIQEETVSHSSLRYRSTSLHSQWLKDIEEGPILLHIDMDYFSNRFDCDSDRLGKLHWYDPSSKEICEEIDCVFASLEAENLTKRIASCHVALSPGFYSGDLWGLGVSRIEAHINRLCDQNSWGPQAAIDGSSHSWGKVVHLPKSRSSLAMEKQSIHLVNGKGSKTRGGGVGGRYWHVFAEGKRVGSVFINLLRGPRGVRPSMQIFLAEKARGRGYGRAAYRMACEESGFPEIYIEMRKSNVASRRAATAAGFEVDPTVKGHQLAMVWRRRGVI